MAGPIVYVAMYALLTVLLFPGTLITAAGGALFGAALATPLTVVGATIGATAAFLIGRRLGRDQVEQIAGRRIGAADRWLSRRGLLAVLYLRLFPIVPFNALCGSAPKLCASRATATPAVGRSWSQTVARSTCCPSTASSSLPAAAR